VRTDERSSAQHPKRNRQRTQQRIVALWKAANLPVSSKAKYDGASRSTNVLRGALSLHIYYGFLAAPPDDMNVGSAPLFLCRRRVGRK